MLLLFHSGPHAASGDQHGYLACGRRGLFYVAAWASVALGLPAQTPTDGAIAGRVVIPGRGAVAGTVSARESESGFARETLSARNGVFLLTHLPPGDYTVEVTGAGLGVLRREHVMVQAGGVTEVSTPTPPDESPFANPDHEANPDSDAEGESLPSYRGLPVTENSLQVDGGSATQSFTAAPAAAGSPAQADEENDADTGATRRDGSARGVRSAAVPYTFARSAIREFHVAGQRYSALFGGAPGGILHTTTRSGGRDLHGELFLLVRNSAFAGTNPYAIATTYNGGQVQSAAVKPHDARQQFGGTASGPMLRDRLFFFAAVDAQRRGYPAISSPQDPNFYSLTATQRALLANRGVRAASIASALSYLDSLTGEVPRRSDGDVDFLRLDQRAGSRVTNTLDYNRARWSQPAGALSAPVVARARNSIGSVTDKVDTVGARSLVFVTAHLSNETRLRYGRQLRYETPQSPLPQEPAIGPGGFAPEVAIGPQGLTFGTPASLGQAAYPDEHRFELAELVSWVHGRQHIQLGGEVSFVHVYVASLPNQEGTFRYDSGVTNGHAGGLVDWITDYTFNVNTYPNGACPSITAATHLFCFRSFTQSFGQQSIAFDTQEWAGYVQDDIRLLPSLTVQAGLRYDYQLLPYPQQPNMAIDATFGSIASTSVFPEDRNNFGPRLALAWSPFGPGGLTLRAGYGVFFGKVPGATLRSALLNTDLPTSTTHIRITPSTETNCPQVANQGFGYPCDYLTSPASALSNQTSAIAFSRRFRLPMVQQGSLTLERDLPWSMQLNATYRINLDRQLPSSVDLNIEPSTATATYQLQGGTGAAGVRDGETFSLPLYTARGIATVGPVAAIISSANATYHGATLEARRAGTRLSFTSALTWSRAIDLAPTQSANPSQNSQLDPFTNRYDRGLSSLNFPFRLTTSAVWHPHIDSKRRELRAVANGWSFTPVFLWRSGTPYSLTLFEGTHLAGGRYSLNGSGGAMYLPTVGRNTLRLPDSTTLNLRVSRNLRLHDDVHLELLAEAYNLPNHVNLSGIVQRAYLVGAPVAGVTPLVFQNAAAIASEGLNAQPFGTFTDSGTSSSRARALQIGLRLQF
jgi:hypothetical protein